MKKLKVTVISGVIGAMMLTSACSKVKPEVNIKQVSAKQTKNVVEASGVVRAFGIRNIVIDLPMGAQVKVSKLNIREGMKVKKGDKLMELDLSDYNALVSQKTKSIDADYLLKKDMVTENQKNAQDLKISALQAELNALKAKVSKSYINGNNIICDIDNAVISDLGYREGDIIGAQQKILSLLDLSSLYIVVNIDEEFIKDVQEGKSVTIIAKYDPTIKVNGKVSRVSSQAVKQNGETVIPVEITIDNGSDKLLPNYNVDVEISKS